MSGGKFIPSVYFRYAKPLPKPEWVELNKIRASLCLTKQQPFPRCPAKDFKKVRKFEKEGNFTHSGLRRNHLCPECMCRRVAGTGTRHYGVGLCFWHDTDNHKLITQSMTIALQQGYPIEPVKYKSDSEYIDTIRRMAEEAHGVISNREELVLLRTHLQEFEKLWQATGEGGLTMKAGTESAPMTDDVKVELLTKLASTISHLNRDQYIITESDYVAISEVKIWLWNMWQCVEKNIKKMRTGEISQEDLEQTIQADFRMIPIPKTGRGKKR